MAYGSVINAEFSTYGIISTPSHLTITVRCISLDCHYCVILMLIKMNFNCLMFLLPQTNVTYLEKTHGGVELN